MGVCSAHVHFGFIVAKQVQESTIKRGANQTELTQSLPRNLHSSSRLAVQLVFYTELTSVSLPLASCQWVQSTHQTAVWEWPSYVPIGWSSDFSRHWHEVSWVFNFWVFPFYSKCFWLRIIHSLFHKALCPALHFELMCMYPLETKSF